jgi:hypothetical protein
VLFGCVTGCKHDAAISLFFLLQICHIQVVEVGTFCSVKGRPVHVAPFCAGFGEGFGHFGSYVRSLSLHFCKRLFLGLEPGRDLFVLLSKETNLICCSGYVMHQKQGRKLSS